MKLLHTQNFNDKIIFQVSMWMRGKTQRRWWGSRTASAPADLQGYILLILFETCWVVVMRGSWTCWSSTWGSTAGPRTDTTSAPSVRASWREHLSRELTTRTFSVILWLMIHKVKFLHSKFCPSILYQFLVLNRTKRWLTWTWFKVGLKVHIVYWKASKNGSWISTWYFLKQEGK